MSIATLGVGTGALVAGLFGMNVSAVRIQLTLTLTNFMARGLAFESFRTSSIWFLRHDGPLCQSRPRRCLVRPSKVSLLRKE